MTEASGLRRCALQFPKLCYPVEFGVTVEFHAYSKLIEDLEKFCRHPYSVVEIRICDPVKCKAIFSNSNEIFSLSPMPPRERGGSFVECSKLATSSLVIKHG